MKRLLKKMYHILYRILEYTIVTFWLIVIFLVMGFTPIGILSCVLTAYWLWHVVKFNDNHNKKVVSMLALIISWILLVALNVTMYKYTGLHEFGYALFALMLPLLG